VGLVISGCDPGSEVSVRASVDVAGAVHEASATFDADETGVVDTSRHPSRAGTYAGVDPFGLWWSGEATAPAATLPLAPMMCRLRAETRHRVADTVLQRRWLVSGVTVTEVDEPGVWGLFARPSGDGPFPGVLAFGGSSGGLGPAAEWAPLLASHGFATLAVGYFGAAALPRTLVEIEVEVAERAVAWLARRSNIASQPVAAMGMSRGSELALLASALIEHMGAVVAFAPSGVSWSGLDTNGPVDAPAWTFRGAPVPYARIGDAARAKGTGSNAPVALRAAFEPALENAAQIRAAEIPVERARGPILMVSGDADAMWPSTPMGEIVERRAKERGFAHEVTHLRYSDAGHLCAGVPGTPVAAEVRHPLTHGLYTFGGTRAGNAAARADSWPRVLAFLEDALTT
jgi:dienelactone hydrolase